MINSDRFQYESDVRSQRDINEAEADVARVDELQMWFRSTAITVAKQLHEIRMLDKNGLRGCDSIEEVIEGAAEEADELFAKLLYKERFDAMKEIAAEEVE